MGWSDGAAEIRKRAGDKNLSGAAAQPQRRAAGQRRYWPIYQPPRRRTSDRRACFGFGGNPITASGWPSYYIERWSAIAVPADRACDYCAGRRVRAHPKTEDGHDRSRLRAGRRRCRGGSTRTGSGGERGAACQASAPPSEYIRDHIFWTTQRWKTPKGAIIVRGDRLGRLGQAIIRDRLSALGLRRSVAGAPGRCAATPTAKRFISIMRGSCTGSHSMIRKSGNRFPKRSWSENNMTDMSSPRWRNCRRHAQIPHHR